MSKTALYIGGYPPGGVHTNTLDQYLESHGYEVIAPDLFSSKEEFNLESLLSNCKSCLNGKEPTLITGISLGGLALPHFVKEYPNAKLLFSTTGPYFKPKSKLFYLLLKLQAKLKTTLLIRTLFLLPKKILIKIMKSIYSFYGDKEMKTLYEKNVVDYINHILAIPPKRHLEAILFVLNMDNTELLKQIENPSLVVSAAKDSLMPPVLGKKLKELLKNSTYLEVKESHLNFITPEEARILKNFLS